MPTPSRPCARNKSLGAMPRIVEIKDQSPLLIKPEDTKNGIVAVCRCGLSANWPYCNGTHKATAGEDPDKLYHYDQQLPQGPPKRHEIDLEQVEKEWREQAAGGDKATDEGEATAEGAEAAGHGAGATPVRPPRPSSQHRNEPATHREPERKPEAAPPEGPSQGV